MLITWIVLGVIVVAMYIIIYKYEKKMNKMQELIEANKDKLGEHHDRINNNHERSVENQERSVANHERSLENHERSKKNQEKLVEHNNHINQMWVTIPKRKTDIID